MVSSLGHRLSLTMCIYSAWHNGGLNSAEASRCYCNTNQQHQHEVTGIIPDLYPETESSIHPKMLDLVTNIKLYYNTVLVHNVIYICDTLHPHVPSYGVTVSHSCSPL